MASHRWLVIPVLVTLSAAAFSACSGPTSPTSTTSGTTSGGMGGMGGAGGAQTTTASTGSGGSSPEAGPLTCPTHTYSTIKTGPCDLLAQNCPDGMTCKEAHPAAVWTTECVLSTGLKGEGETCVKDAECLAKLTCAAGRCAPVCCAATNAPCLGGICDLFFQVDELGTANKEVCHYAKACTLLIEDACEQGYGCHIEDAKQGLATCVQGNTTPAPDLGACKHINDCPDMEDCFQGANSLKKCHAYCTLGQADPASPPAGLGGCPAGQTCQANVDGKDVNFNLSTIGLCAPLN
jgi:hypothetical protein